MIAHPILTALIAAGIVVAVVVLAGWLRDRARRVASRVRQGLAILGRPREYVRRVVPWQALGRLVRDALERAGLPVRAPVKEVLTAGHHDDG